MNSQTGCRPASAAPTVRPQKPDSVMGESMTRLSPNLSNSPFVTLYLCDCQLESNGHDRSCCSMLPHCARAHLDVSTVSQWYSLAQHYCTYDEIRYHSSRAMSQLLLALCATFPALSHFSHLISLRPSRTTPGSDLRAVILCNLLTQHKHLRVRLELLDQSLIQRISHRHLLRRLHFLSRMKRPRCRRH